VPSRMYNIMAAGKPIIAITDEDSELAMVILEENIGWVVGPGDVAGFISAIQEAKNNLEELIAMGIRARQAAEDKYSYKRIIAQYRTLFAAL